MSTYPPVGSAFNFKLIGGHLIFSRCVAVALDASELPLLERVAATAPCPCCGNTAIKVYLGYGNYCPICGMIWNIEAICCQTCGRFISLHKLPTTQWQCDICGSLWDEDVLISIYRNQDELHKVIALSELEVK
jgi:hypothetical protein